MLLCFFQSISFGANGGVFVETTYKGNGKAIINAIIDTYFNGGDTTNTSYLDTESAIFHSINQPFTSICIQFKKGTGTYWTHYLNVAISNTSFTFTDGGNKITEVKPYTNYQLSNYRNSLSGSITNQNTDFQINLGNLGTTDDLVAVYSSTYSNKWYQNSISAIHIGDYREIPNITFTPTSLASSVSYSGDNVNVVRVGRSVNSWNLGQFSSNFKECKQFNVYLAPVVNISNGSMISDGGYASSIYYKNVGINNQNKLSLGDNGYVSIPNNYIYYNQLYVLNYFGYDNDNQEIATGQSLFYFKTLDSDTSIGSLINPLTTTDIDIGWINSAGNFWENSISATSGDIDYFVGSTIFNDFFSGDFLSGDVFANMPYVQRENRFSNLILSIYRNVIDCFLNVPQNPSITFDFKGHTYTFYASDFSVPNNSLKEFVRVFLIVGIGILIYQQFHYIIINLSTLNIYGSLKSLEHKHTFFM